MGCTLKMTTLRRARNGDWFARKRIPEDILKAYESIHGPGHTEERFRLPASLPQSTAMQAFRDWDAEVSSRIERLRLRKRGEGEPSLTPRQAHALAGQWYSWFLTLHEEDPGTADEWGIVADEYEAACLRFRPRDEHTDLLQQEDEQPRSLAERDAIHRVLMRRGSVDRFLLDHENRSLSDAALHTFLDVLEGEFPAAVRVLSRRAEGDWSRDSRPEKFPPAQGSSRQAPDAKLSGLTVWSAFELWIEGRKPATASINRWRSVFVNLRERFGDTDAARITPEEAQQWADILTTPERSAHVVNGVWLKAARVVFEWAVKRKRLRSNPFADVSIALPKRPPKLREREFNEEEWRIVLMATLSPLPSPLRIEPHTAAARRWVPWLCAYTGARSGEACQLRAEDIRQHTSGGFWYARITPEAGAVKGDAAREVPLHPHLIEQGFIEFAQGRHRGPLFYDLRRRGKAPRRNEDAASTSPLRDPWLTSREMLSKWVRSLPGLDDPGISPNHAWRHTWKRRAARAGIERRFRFAMCGHASKEEGDGYETPTLEDLAEMISAFPRYEA
jgi:integrase